MKALISGASIAGLTTAYWLARYGFETTVVERAKGLRPGGQGVDVREVALDVVKEMGLLSRIRDMAADVREISFVDADGKQTARVDLTGGDGVEIMRGDLVALLHEAAAGVEYLFGDSIKSIDDRLVRFESGLEREFDVVIGADGIHSNTRRLAFGPEERFVQYRGHYFAFGNTDPGDAADRTVTMYNTPGRMDGIYRSGNHPQTKGYLIVSHPEPSAEVAAQLRAHFDDPDAYVDSLSQVKMTSWSTGRVALVGDAAYCASPASGAGAELAITGAYRLATALGQEPSLEAAFRRYEAEQRALVEARQDIEYHIQLMVPATEEDIEARNASLTAEL